MKAFDGTVLGRRARQVWFPCVADEALAELRAAPFVDVMQCDAEVAAALTPWAWRARPFHTALIDLRREETALWEALEKKTCRYQINRARKLAGVEIRLNRDPDAAFALIDAFIRRTAFRAPIAGAEWRRIVAASDVFVACQDGRPLVTHVILVDGDRCARALISATADRADGGERALVSALNRLLHWHEILHYRAAGVATYDLGGVVLDPQAAEWSISQFKAGFGGTVVTQHVVRLARNPLLRWALRRARRAPAAEPPPAEADRGAA